MLDRARKSKDNRVMKRLAWKVLLLWLAFGTLWLAVWFFFTFILWR
jgi:hypothetical protein